MNQAYFKVGLLIIFSLFIREARAQQTDTISSPTHTEYNPSSMTKAQKLIASTGEDLLSGNNANEAQTVISGYGNISFQRDFKYRNATASLDRGVIFLGHQFNNKIAFFSELEVADAKVEGGKLHGEIGFEQLYMKFSINPRHYFVAGLFLPRLGILNENHLPVNYNGTERPMVEQLIIPSTWRELGIGYYGQMSRAPITYSVAILNGLNASQFVHGSGIGGGKGEGQLANFNSIAITGAVQAFVDNFRFQVSGYAGGSIPLNKFQSDSLDAPKGLFAAPVYLGEANVQYNNKGFYGKILGTYVALPQSNEINTLFANNTPSSMYGAYAEVGYNIFENTKSEKLMHKQLIGFVRFEKLNANLTIPSSGITDGTLDQSHFLVGFNFLPINNVVLKADLRFTHTGPQNKALFLNPPPVMMPYQQNNTFLNVGIGYSF